MIIARTPYRFSFAGGGTDFPEWFSSNPSIVVTSTLDYYSYITLRNLENFFEHNYRVVYSLAENVIDIEEIKHPVVRESLKYFNINFGVEIHHDGELPAKSGLGSSSSFTVGLIQALHALTNKEVSKRQLADLAIKMEREILNENVGLQDQVASSYGGFNVIEFNSQTNFNVIQLKIDNSRLGYLEKCIKLIYTGKQRFSSKITQDLKRNLESATQKVFELQLKNCELAQKVKQIFEDNNSDLNDIAKIFNESWIIKSELNPSSITADLIEIRNLGLRAGATGAKVLGAGGGGFIAFWVDPRFQERFLSEMSGFIVIDIKFENRGSKIIYNSNFDVG